MIWSSIFILIYIITFLLGVFVVKEEKTYPLIMVPLLTAGVSTALIWATWALIITVAALL
jgi:hypothetical protein